MQIRRGDQRYRTDADGITTFHSFSYGHHYDPTNLSFGAIIALNDETVPPGGGYEPHRHSDVTITTVVLDGALAHADSVGRRYVLKPGDLRSVDAGDGIEHSERNASDREPLRFLQVMTRAGAAVDIRAVKATSLPQLLVGPALLHVMSGTVSLGDHTLGPSDEARVPADQSYDLSASADAEALVCQESM